MSFITLDTLQSQNIAHFSISTICFLQHNLHEDLFIHTIHWLSQWMFYTEATYICPKCNKYGHKNLN
jgi:hypothetical protein